MSPNNPLDLAKHLHYEHIPHPHIAARHAEGPVKVADQHRTDNAATRFNTKAALLITRAVGSMWCAYLFAAFDMISLPSAIRGGASTIVAWVAQTFLQLVLLSVIMVGQNVQAAAADARSEATYHDASATLHETAQLQEHLAAQDMLLTRIAAHLGLDPVPVIDMDEPNGGGAGAAAPAAPAAPVAPAAPTAPATPAADKPAAGGESETK